MAPLLIVRFIAPDQVEWLAEAAGVRRGTLAELAEQAAGWRLLLVAPSEAVLLTQAMVPGRSRAARLKALPFALEDNLAEDVEALHIAVGRLQPQQPIAVAVVSHALMREWLTAFAEAELTVQAIIPDSLLLPYKADAWSVLAEDQRVVVRQGPWSGFAGEQDELELLLQLALAEADERPPAYLRVWGEVTPALVGLGLEIRRENSPVEPLQVLAAGYPGSTLIDLLQGPYSRQANLSQWLRPWRMAAALAGVWLGLQGVAQIMEYRQLQQEQAELRSEMERVYRDAAPTAQRIVNPRVQLEGQLKELRRANGAAQAAFLDLLYQGSQPLSDFKDLSLRSLRYKSDQLDLDLEGGSLETLDRLRERLSQRATLEAQVRTTKREGKVESQITLRKAPLHER